MPENPAIHEHQMLAQEFTSIHGRSPVSYGEWSDELCGEIVERVVGFSTGLHNAKGTDEEAAKAAKAVEDEATQWLEQEGKKLGWSLSDVKQLPQEREKCEEEIKDEIDAQKLRAIIADMHAENRRKNEKGKEGPGRSALCISGGGIRSATFALGVIQALANEELLGKFHYLSTVSGGGYIGSWLTAWLHHETSPGKQGKYFARNEPSKQPWDSLRENALNCVQRQLVSKPEPATRHNECTADPITPLHPEPKPLEHLRANSNYLSPRLGLLSGDSWTLVAIYLRNLLLNWLVIVPWLFVALLLPRVSVQTLRWAPYMWNQWSHDRPLVWGDLLFPSHDWHFALLGWVAVAGMAWAIIYMVLHVPSALGERASGTNSQRSFLVWCLIPFFIAGSALTVLGYLVICETTWLKENSKDVYKNMAYFGAAVHLAGTLLAWFWRSIGKGVSSGSRRLDSSGNPPNATGGKAQAKGRILHFLWDLFRMLFSITVSGAVAGALWVWLFSHCIQEPYADNPEGFACLGSGLFLLAFLVGMILFIGFTSTAKNESRMLASDADREWWARAGAWMLLGGLIWIALSAISLYGPRFLQLGVKQIAAVGGVSGLVTVLLGFSAKSGGKQEGSTAKPGLGAVIAAKAPEFAAPVFLVFLLIMVSLLTTLLFYHVDDDIETTVASGENKAMKARILEAEREILKDARAYEVEIDYKHETLRSDKREQPKKHEDDPAHSVQKSTTWREVKSAKQKVPWLPPGASHHQQVVRLESWSVLIWSLIGFSLLGLSASLFVNVNLFSLHGMYRDRLIRAYLAASRPDHERKENLFTGFDQDDNLQMFTLWPQKEEGAQVNPGGRRLFHVINTALNLVAGERLAWQERMAASFVITPLHCGSAALANGYGYRRTVSSLETKEKDANKIEAKPADKPAPGQIQAPPATESERRQMEVTPADEPTATDQTKAKTAAEAARRQTQANRVDELAPGRYGGGYGITLGTAMTISGAAVNSNWGYHSSPVVTFLLTLFNARLGWWLGNPSKAGDKTYERWFPGMGIDPIFHEAFGLTNEDYSYVDLSDGGHFDNMGLYEMVRRRCRVIVLIDGEADGEYTYEGLGMAIRKIRIDFGIPITFPSGEALFAPKDQDKGEFRPSSNEKNQPRFAIGSIEYSAMDRTDKKDDGVLLYIKPVCYGSDGSEPRDVVQYKRSNPAFPNESTVDQFFSESQFESYRALGRFTADEILKSLESKPNQQAADFGAHTEVPEHLQKFLEACDRCLS